MTCILQSHVGPIDTAAPWSSTPPISRPITAVKLGCFDGHDHAANTAAAPVAAAAAPTAPPSCSCVGLCDSPKSGFPLTSVQFSQMIRGCNYSLGVLCYIIRMSNLDCL